MAGFEGKVAGQAAYSLEQKNPKLKELLTILEESQRAKSLTEDKSALNNTIDALAMQKGTEDMLATIEGADGETARRIQFFRDIITGKTKTVRKTKKYNAMGGLVETKLEEISDIEVRMKARKELDKILGLNAVIDLDELKMGDITINIVDASKREEVEDSRNKVTLDLDKMEEIDGEEVCVTEEVEKKESPKKRFEEVVSEGNGNE